MATVEERLASLEARMGKMDDLQTLMAALREDLNRGFTHVREELVRQREDVTLELAQAREDTARQFAQMRDDMSRQFTQVREDMAEIRADMRGRFEQVDRRFTWVLGVQMALMLAVIGALLGAYVR